MLCENCNSNYANYHYKTSVNGESKEIHLCAECAGKLGYDKFLETSFGMDSILSKFMGDARPKTGIRCASCGSTSGQLTETGRVGCAECYKTFSGMLLPYIKKVQPGMIHTGRVPKSRVNQISVTREIKRLKAEQREAIDSQDFERAATLRDEIRRLEGGGMA